MHDHVLALVKRFGRHAYEALGNGVTRRALYVDGVAFNEGARERLDPDAQEAAAVVLERLERALVDRERSLTRDREGDPRFSSRQTLFSRVKIVPTPPSSAWRSAWRALAGAMTVVTPDQVAMCAAAIFEAIPPLPTPERLAPAASMSDASIVRTSSMSVAVASTRGSAVKRPTVSVSSTR